MNAMKVLNTEAIGSFEYCKRMKCSHRSWTLSVSPGLRLIAPAMDMLSDQRNSALGLSIWRKQALSEGIFPEEVGRCVKNNNYLSKIYRNLMGDRLRQGTDLEVSCSSLDSTSCAAPSPFPWHLRCSQDEFEELFTASIFLIGVFLINKPFLTPNSDLLNIGRFEAQEPCNSNNMAARWWFHGLFFDTCICTYNSEGMFYLHFEAQDTLYLAP